MQEDKTPKIRVLIRKRPMNKKEQSRNQTDIISIENNKSVIVREQKLKVDLTPFIDEYRFNFDGAYDQFATNEQIYVTAVRPLVDCAFDGAKVSCFAYGQTGSGKTHTMLGNGTDVKGLYLLAASDIFKEIKNYPEIQAWISFYEIYCGKLYDLLNQKYILHARQDGKNNVNIVGLSQTKIQSAQNLMQVIEYGTSIRVTSQNGTNNDSSRSHAILQISLKKRNKPHGKITFIDLAGSERAADHADQLQKQTRIDGAEINKSLLALKQCIRALDQNKNHTPFRGSKLTMVLKDSFTGYCRTVMIGNISPNSLSSENTLNTLKYADRVKELKKPSKQNFIQMEKIDQLQKELMLPRNIHRKVSRTSGNEEENYREFRENINQNVEPNFNKKGHGYEQNNLPMKKLGVNNLVNNSGVNGHKQLGNIQQRRHSPIPNNGNYTNNFSNNFSNNFTNNFTNNNYNSTKNHPQPNNIHHQNPIKPPYQQHSPNRYGPQQNNQFLIQQNEPNPQLMRQTDLLKLSQRHDQYVQLILQQEEALLKHHEQHINLTIELTKKEMLIKSEADKIGSRIEDYLENLSSVLDAKVNSIFAMKERIEKIKDHLEESKNLQEQYQVASRSLGLAQQNQDDNFLLLDDDEPHQQLFIN